MNDKPMPPVTPDTRAFWEGCAAGELRVQRCAACGTAQLPPRARCTGCGATSLDWTAVAPRGEVYSFTVVHRAPSAAFREDVPYVVALVDIAGHARLMMNVEACAPDTVRIGLPVRIGFAPRRGDDGSEVWLPVATPEDAP